jgi:hypothetical protein
MTFHAPNLISSRKPQSESCKDVWQNNKIIRSKVSRYGRLWEAHIKPKGEYYEDDEIQSNVAATVYNFFA